MFFTVGLFTLLKPQNKPPSGKGLKLALELFQGFLWIDLRVMERDPPPTSPNLSPSWSNCGTGFKKSPRTPLLWAKVVVLRFKLMRQISEVLAQRREWKRSMKHSGKAHLGGHPLCGLDGERAHGRVPSPASTAERPQMHPECWPDLQVDHLVVSFNPLKFPVRK